jgi:hypothetical protein
VLKSEAVEGNTHQKSVLEVKNLLVSRGGKASTFIFPEGEENLSRVAFALIRG